MFSKSELIIQQYLFLSKNEDRRLNITFSKPFQCNPSFFIFPRLGASKLAQNSFSSFSIIFFFSESFYMFYMKLHCMKFGFFIFFLYSLFLWRMAFLSPSNNQGLRVLYLICTFCFGIYISYNFSGADNCKNRSNYDTINRFGTNTLRGSLFKKITRATQNFKMAVTFQDGCHGVSWNVIFALKMAVNGQKRLLWQHSVCFDHAKCTINVINTIQMFRLFQYGRQFPRWPPWAIA